MIYTNKRNLPKPLVDAVIALNEKEHTSADYSVTQLNKGTTEIVLSMLHKNELVVDVSELMAMLFGSGVHLILEQFGGQDAEIYMETEVNGRTVSGTADLAEENLITDWKTCPTWKIIFKDFDDWRTQVKGYLYLNYKNTGKLITNGRIIAILKDWSMTNAKRDKTYPQSPAETIDFTFTEDEILETENEWTAKILDIENAKSTGNYLACTEKERWHEADVWALMKEGRKSAVKLFDNEAEAKAACTEKNLSVEHRVGRDKKCDDYCIVGKNGFCPHYNATHKNEEESDE